MMDHYAKAYPIFSRIKGYWRYVDMLKSLRRYGRDEVAQQRMKIMKFYDRYGEKATQEAFGADRKVIHRWKKRLREHNGKLFSLVPLSTRPKSTRRSTVSVAIVDFIKRMREEHPRIGKEKIKPLLDEYCIKNGLNTISESTVGNIIKRHNFFLQRSGRIYHNPQSKWALNKGHRDKRLRIKYPPKPKDFGHILSDAVERITDGIRDYFISAIDAKMKFALTLNYKRLTSRNMNNFYHRFRLVYPLKIKDWQTDNGTENLGEFDQQLKRDKIPHIFSYPHCPKINTYIERYNRTVQEEFIDNNLHIIHDKYALNKALVNFLLYYNSVRPHKSLGLKSPLDFLVSNGEMSHLSLTYTCF